METTLLVTLIEKPRKVVLTDGRSIETKLLVTHQKSSSLVAWGVYIEAKATILVLNKNSQVSHEYTNAIHTS